MREDHPKAAAGHASLAKSIRTERITQKRIDVSAYILVITKHYYDRERQNLARMLGQAINYHNWGKHAQALEIYTQILPVAEKNHFTENSLMEEFLKSYANTLRAMKLRRRRKNGGRGRRLLPESGQ